MTIKMLVACAAAVVVFSNGAAEEFQEKESEKSLERPPALSEGVAGDTEKESVKSLEQPPPLSEDTGNDEELEPTVTIKEQGEVTVYEYRLNGLLYGVRVVPKNAPAYYLVDTDGDGFMDWRRNDLTSPEINRIPAWVLFRW
ncbi:MAG: DUF2782 domain-containing protein [Gammaproteobacteria bacterium]|jgi:hypothetical protein